MAVAKRSGCDFLFLANTHSQKFSDLEHASVVNICFHNSTNQDWVSITGKATKTDNSDPRIKELWNRGASAWFGDLGDGKHDGSANDPRMALIEVKPNCEYITGTWSIIEANKYSHHILEVNVERSRLR